MSYVPLLDVMLSGMVQKLCVAVCLHVTVREFGEASTFRILKNVVTNSLVKQFSFQESGTKRAFRSLKLYSVVEGNLLFIINFYFYFYLA